MSDFEWPEVRRHVYGDEGATFVPVCKTCGRFVKADPEMTFKGPIPQEPNANCSKCGRVAMYFEGYY